MALTLGEMHHGGERGGGEGPGTHVPQAQGEDGSVEVQALGQNNQSTQLSSGIYYQPIFFYENHLDFSIM